MKTQAFKKKARVNENKNKRQLIVRNSFASLTPENHDNTATVRSFTLLPSQNQALQQQNNDLTTKLN